MMRPPRPCSHHDARRRLGEEERRLQIDVVLEVPIGLADFEHAGAADQHRGRLHERVETAEALGDPLDERLRDRRRACRS